MQKIINFFFVVLGKEKTMVGWQGKDEKKNVGFSLSPTINFHYEEVSSQEII
jgi:hypothetical protein